MAQLIIAPRRRLNSPPVSVLTRLPATALNAQAGREKSRSTEPRNTVTMGVADLGPENWTVLNEKTR